MKASIISIVNGLKTSIEQLVFDIGQGKDHKSLHSSALTVLVKTAELEKRIEETGASIQQRSIDSAGPRNSDEVSADEIDKVARKLPKWVNNPHQINSKILNLFLYLQQQNPNGVTEGYLKSGYGNDSEFDRNFPQMKTISQKNHAKVFEINSGFVEIWNPVVPMVKDYEGRLAKVNFERDLGYIHDAFKEIFGREGRSFGPSSAPFRKGVSDDNDGVQWNLVVDGNEGVSRLGVNLEGMKYDDWPIARFIEKELSDPASGLPSLSGDYLGRADVVVRMVRDAWQAAARLPIQEKIIGGSYVPLAELTSERWETILQEAYACLDESKNHRARAAQTVTLEKTGEQITREVTPHMTITTPLWRIGPPSLDSAIETVRTKMESMRAIYDHVTNSIS